MSTSMTTREPRGNEQNGKEYFFVTKEEFEERIKNNQFLEYAVVHSGKYYGTPKDKIYDKLNSGIDVILEIDIQGALEIQQKISDALFIFIMPPSMRILKERLTNRGTESEEKVENDLSAPDTQVKKTEKQGKKSKKKSKKISSIKKTEDGNDLIDNALDELKLEKFQYPPIYSAIKVNGKKLYEYAREGKIVEVKKRDIEIYRFPSWGLTYLCFTKSKCWSSTEEVPAFDWIDTPDCVK